MRGGILCVVFLALGLCACALPKGLPEKGSDGNASLIYGYIDMSDAPAALEWVTYKQYKPVTDAPYFYMRVTGNLDDGYVFYREVPATGSFQVTSFGGEGSGFLDSTQYRFYFPEGKNETAVVLQQDGIYFMGAYKYVPIEKGFLEQPEYELQPANISPQEALKRILPHTSGTQWEAALRAALGGTP